MHVRHGFDENLKDLHLDVVKMASLVEKTVEDAIQALKQKDTVLARKIIKQDDVIDEMERTIENKCINLIAMQQPLARDLRMITAILKMITDLERIADHSTDIGKLIVEDREEEQIKLLADIPKMALVAREMVRGAIDAYVNNDIQLAQDICSKDTVVDNYFDSLLEELQDIMKRRPECINEATKYIFIVKYLEKIGDHATNIGEWVIYNITGNH